MAGRVEGEERIEFVRPVGHDLHELAACQKGGEAKCEALKNSLTGHTSRDRYRRIIHHETTGNVDIDDLAAALKTPRKRHTSLRIAEEQRFVMNEIMRRSRHAMAL